MKKLLTPALAVVLAAALAAPASAAADLDASPAQNQVAGDYAIAVNGTYSASAADEQISVDIAWEAMTFTYTAGKATYHPADHSVTNAPGSWNTDKPGITVKNHSNTGIEASFAFKAADGVKTTGTFYSKSGENYTALAANKQHFTLESAAGKTRNDTDSAADQTPQNTLYFGVSGEGVSAGQTLGNITVTVAKDTTVKTAADFVTAFDAVKTTGGTVKLGADVTLASVTSGMFNVYNRTAPIVLDLNGYTLTGMLIVSGQTGTGDEEMVIKNGTVEYAYTGSQTVEIGAITMMVCNLTLTGVTVNTTGIVPLANYDSSATVTDSTLNGGVVYPNTDEIGTVYCGGPLTLSGNVTVSNEIFATNIGAADLWSVTLKQGCKHKINGATAATTVTQDITYKSASTDCPDWIYRR